MRRTFTILLFFICTKIVAQTDRLPPVLLTHINDENGLSDNHITCVYKDNAGLLWVGTKDGLNLLDGSTIRIYKYDPADTSSICSNYINGITEDKKGTIWIATANGFCTYNNSTRKFSSIVHYDPGKKDLGSISNIDADRYGHLWMGTRNGLFQYDPAAKKITQYYNSSTAFESDTKYSNNINKVLSSSEGLIWLATSDGLWSYSAVKSTFTKVIHKKNDPYYHPLCQTVYEDEDKNIWAGFWHSGLKKYTPRTSEFSDHGTKLNHDYGISNICEIKRPDGKKLLLLNGRMMVYDEIKDEYFSYPPPVSQREFPMLDPVYRSRDGWIWLAADDGLYIYNPSQQVFTHQLFDIPITTQAVVLSSYKNDLLIGAQGGSFLQLKDQKNNLIKDYSERRRKEAAMLYIFHESPADLWMGTSDGILHSNLETGYQKWFYHLDNDSSSLPRDFIASVFIDSKKNTWIFPWREGIWQMDKETGACKKIFDGFINESGKIKKLLISDAKEDTEGNIWMADLDEGIILYEPTTNRFSKPFEKEIGSRAHTAKIYLHDQFAYSALPSSILKWNVHDKKLQSYPLPAELNKAIEDFCPDKDGDWWLATTSGLIVFNEAGRSFRKFTVADGLYQNDVDGTLFCTITGEMIIANPRYISRFDPKQLNNSSTERKNILLMDFIASGQQQTIPVNSNISLPNDQNNIIIRWTLPVYSNPFKNKYYYQLQGIDSTWRYAGNTGEVQYASLSSGRYTILLKAKTANETESANIITLHFTINPPFWKTWWFIALMILAVSSLFFAVVRYISQRNLKEKLLKLEKEQAIEKERNRISRDMHDDLGSGLTKIAIMSEVVKKQMNEPEKAKQQLESISESSRELVDNLQDIIWVLNPKNDTLESLAVYIREYGLKFFELFSVSLHFNYPEKFLDLKLSEETRRNIFLVIKESFNNIAKHASCNTIWITIEQQDELKITIKDDGKGFDKNNLREFANGLQNMKNRMEQIGGYYGIVSEPGKGTTTTVVVNRQW